MAFINLYLRFLSLVFILDTITFGFGLQTPSLRPLIANIIAEKDLAGLAASSLATNFILPSFAAASFALATACGYGATYWAPKDKVKLVRGLFFRYVIESYLFIVDIKDGKTDIWKNIETAYGMTAFVSVLSLIAFILSFTSGGKSSHEPAATPGKSGKKTN